ncbi:MAG TPA: hypothetical protein VFZ59_12500 [Verrucomicrobiae bacterium]|nr:hypothetical protein [Verrucomicrobiae bacterium]
MKAIYARTNPAFKRTQLLPVVLNLLPPATGAAAAREFSAVTPPTIASEPKVTNMLTPPGQHRWALSVGELVNE